jgi:hypothetical protein
MGWRFISRDQAEKQTKAEDHEVVRFIVGPQVPGSASGKFDSTGIVTAVTSLLKRQTEGWTKQDRVDLEALLQAAITKVLR